MPAVILVWLIYIQTLTTLDLRDNKLGNRGLRCIVGALSKIKVRIFRLCTFWLFSFGFLQKTLRVVSIQRNSISSVGVQDLVAMFHHQPIVRLDLTGNRIDDEGAKHIANLLHTNTVSMNFLEQLYLWSEICSSTDTHNSFSSRKPYYKQRTGISCGLSAS